MLKINRIIIALVVIHFYSININSQTSITLKQALISAKQNNPILKTENFNIGIAQADITTAKLRPNPTLNNQSLQLLNPAKYFPNTGFANALNRQVWWQVTKQFQLPSQRKYKIEFAEKNVNTIQKNYAETERNLYLNVGINWVEAWYAKVNLDLIYKAYINIDSLVYINKLRLKNQVITATDLIRTQLLSEQYQLQKNSAQRDYINQLQDLKFLLGTNDSISIDANNDFILTQISGKIDSLLNYSATNRSDIIVAQSLIEIATSNISLQKANAKPIPELGIIYNPQNTIPYIGIFGTIQLPFFSRNQGEIQKSKIIKAQSEQNLVVVQQQLKTEITTTYTSYQLHKQTVEKYRIILTQSEQILNSVKYSYLKGGTTIIDFLEAQRTWFETQKTYYESIYNYRKSYVQLLHATGLINQLK